MPKIKILHKHRWTVEQEHFRIHQPRIIVRNEEVQWPPDSANFIFEGRVRAKTRSHQFQAMKLKYRRRSERSRKKDDVVSRGSDCFLFFRWGRGSRLRYREWVRLRFVLR